MEPQAKYVKRFLSRLIVDDGCWHYKRAGNLGNVPSLSYGYDAEVGTYGCSASRLSLHWFQRIDWDSMKGLQTRHLCDDRTCVNPAHLTLGTRSENQLDITRPKREMDSLRRKVRRRLRKQLF